MLVASVGMVRTRKLTVDFAGVEGAECARKSAITGFLGFSCRIIYLAGFLLFTEVS